MPSKDSLISRSRTSRSSETLIDKSMSASDSVNIYSKFYMRNRMDTVTERQMESSSTLFHSQLKSMHSRDEELSKNFIIENTQDTRRA
ncbi:unnamed protein product [Moneuplotes crassus]|uniref:Uncharacterized protein n=1 Tax=Euplotes crassus TaxID=5936 RepID=A0AAD2D9N1_EUPCR|nr:unnamed protein product [Moneuplotes crassus]|mmetsp:Transcript_16964/g.16637  ORF Transcript_16964/g.16637 Transcript_16964/m.16637 type:complete len:88 (-) Transcript_16964:15-278(-)